MNPIFSPKSLTTQRQTTANTRSPETSTSFDLKTNKNIINDRNGNEMQIKDKAKAKAKPKQTKLRPRKKKPSSKANQNFYLCKVEILPKEPPGATLKACHNVSPKWAPKKTFGAGQPQTPIGEYSVQLTDSRHLWSLRKNYVLPALIILPVIHW